MTHPRLGRSLAGVLALAATVALAGCGSGSKELPTGNAELPDGQPGSGKPAVTIGDKNFTEQYILGQLYAQALRAKGYTIHLKADIGPSEVIDPELTRGTIDLYPEYTGVIDSAVANLSALAAPGTGGGITSTPKSAADAYHQAADFESRRGLKLLNPTPYENADRVATTPAFAKKHDLSTMTDLSKLSSFSYGAPPENRNRYEGLRGMKQAYGLNHAKFVSEPIGAQYKALASGKVDTIAVFTTDGQLMRGGYAVLSDPRRIFGYQNVAPVVSKKVLAREGPQFAQTLNAVSATLTTRAIQTMNAAVDLDHKNPKDVAGSFLAAHVLP
ncbi:MAG: glycine betaine ABC transporter substrate-binding protein [Mycobacteriales bacterium]